MDCIFCKIIAGEIPSAKVYEDDHCYAFKDISPLAPTHFLVVPKQHFASAAEVTPENEAVVGHIYTVIAKLAREMGFADGYRVVTNVGELAGQTVHHIHFHVLSGKQLGALTEVPIFLQFSLPCRPAWAGNLIIFPSKTHGRELEKGCSVCYHWYS